MKSSVTSTVNRVIGIVGILLALLLPPQRSLQVATSKAKLTL